MTEEYNGLMQNHTWSFVQSGNSNQNPSLTSDLLIRPGNLRSGRGISVRILCLLERSPLFGHLLGLLFKIEAKQLLQTGLRGR